MLLDGRALAQTIQAQLKIKIAAWQAQVGRPPGLAVLMAGEHPPSQAYVRNKNAACERIGIARYGQHFPADVSAETLRQTILALNADPNVDGILIQLPLPVGLDELPLLLAIDPDKDADGLHPVNMGRLLRGEPGLRSCTPAGVMAILRSANIEVAGQKAVVVGRSLLVGKPVALMLLEANATVVMAHSRTPDLAAVTREADILVPAVGKPGLITAAHVKPGAVVVDVGINRLESGQLVGDVDFAAVALIARAITPVPGGVGPMTVTMLLYNTCVSFCRQNGLVAPDWAALL